MTIVSDAEALCGTLKRLHYINDQVLFNNEEESFKISLRSDPVDPETVGCELCVLFDEDDPWTKHVLQFLSSHNGYVEDADTYVVDSWTFPLDKLCAKDAEGVANVINEVYHWKICPCQRYVIKDDAPVCMFCQMTSVPEGRQAVFCAICHEDGPRMHMRCQPCCAQLLHRRCLDSWRNASGDERCPLCRQDQALQTQQAHTQAQAQAHPLPPQLPLPMPLPAPVVSMISS
jgi:hypothetical protein